MTFWKSSETNTWRNEERERGRKNQPPGGQRRRKLNLHNGYQKPAREFASSEIEFGLKSDAVFFNENSNFKHLHTERDAETTERLLFAGRQEVTVSLHLV